MLFPIKSRTDDFVMREGEVYGPIILSVQASEHHYCTPRESWYDNIEDYFDVELGIFDTRKVVETEFGSKYHKMVLPSELGIDGMDNEFSSNVAPYVDWGYVNKLRATLKEKFGDPISTADWEGPDEAKA